MPAFRFSYGPSGPPSTFTDASQFAGGECNAGLYRNVIPSEEEEAEEEVEQEDAEQSTELVASECEAWKAVAARLRQRVEDLDNRIDEQDVWKNKYLETEKLLVEERKRSTDLEAGIVKMMDSSGGEGRKFFWFNLLRRNVKENVGEESTDVDLLGKKEKEIIVEDISVPEEVAETKEVGECVSCEKQDRMDELTEFSSLTPSQITRYSRQLLIRDGFGVEGQKKLLDSKILVVGAGGIGSSVLLYLAAAGIGHITIMDHDNVDSSNLHRQIIHSQLTNGTPKSVSAAGALANLNSSIRVTPLTYALTSENALELCESHDVIIDASDNPKTRFLINDASVLSGKPLVSGSAMGLEGQLTVYNVGGGGCYRCLYPKSDPNEGCKSCSDNGVLGMVPGLIGVLQGVEVIKIITGMGSTMHDRLLMYDSLNCTFLKIRKPPPRSNCAVCGPKPTITTMADSNLSSQEARGPTIPELTSHPLPPSVDPNILPNHLTISCQEFNSQIRQKDIPHVLLDLRVKRQFEICSIGARDTEDPVLNIPLEDLIEQFQQVEDLSGGTKPVYCLCRRGIASAEATRLIAERMESGISKIPLVQNIAGGLNSWVEHVNPDFPMY